MQKSSSLIGISCLHRQKSERAIKPENEPKLPQGKKNLNHYKTYGYTRAQRLEDLTLAFYLNQNKKVVIVFFFRPKRLEQGGRFCLVSLLKISYRPLLFQFSCESSSPRTRACTDLKGMRAEGARALTSFSSKLLTMFWPGPQK